MSSKVVIGIIVKDDEVLIVHRKKSEGSLSWQFPGGTVEENESEEEAIEREIYEESGLNCKALKVIGERVHPYTKKEMIYYECKYVDGIIFVDDDEIDKAEWVKIKNITNYFTTDLFAPVKKHLNIV